MSDTWAGIEFHHRNDLWVPVNDAWWVSFGSFARWVIPGNQGSDGGYSGKPVCRQHEIEAWRLWTLAWDREWRPVLRSLTWDYSWTGPVVRTVKPTADGDKGFWATKRLREAKRFVDGWQVYGRVALSGTVVEGTLGYRAQQAAIRSLVVRKFRRSASTDILNQLADRYQCDVRFR